METADPNQAGPAGPVVLDASVVLRWFLPGEPDARQAMAIRDRIVAGDLQVRQPPHFPMETASALVAAARLGRIEPAVVPPLLRTLERLRLAVVEPHGFAVESAAAAFELGLRVPDAGYVVCARRVGGTLLTADRRLFEAAERAGDAVAWLGSLPE